MDSKEEDTDPNNKKKSEASTSTSNLSPGGGGGYVLGDSSSELQLRQRSVENNSQTPAVNVKLNNPFSQLVNNHTQQQQPQETSLSSPAPPLSNTNTAEQQQHQNRPSSTPPPQRRHVPINNNQIPPITENLYQFQIRCILFLACAIFLGYMYIQIESNQSMLQYKLVPDTYSSLRSSPKRHSSVKNPNNYKSKPTSHSSPETPQEMTVEEEESESMSMISPEYRLQANYLSKVLKSLGDMSKKFETNSNGSLIKSIQGIVEMKAEYVADGSEVEEEEAEDKNVPEYMKRLGSVIDDLKKAKVDSKNPGQKFKKFKPPSTKKLKQQVPDGVLKKSEQDDKEWTEFVNDLVETSYKLSREGNNEEGQEENEKSKKITKGGKYGVNNYITNNDDDDGNDRVNVKHKDSVTLNNRRKEGILDIDSDSDVLDLGLDDDSLFNEELDHLEEEEEDQEEEEEMYDELKFQQKQPKVDSKTFSESKQKKIKERLNFLEKLLEASNDDLNDEEVSILLDKEEQNSLKTQFEKNNFQNQKSSFSDKTYKEHKKSKSQDNNRHNDNDNNLFHDDNLYTLE